MDPIFKSFLSGVALTIGLFAVFLVLKLTGVISWSWWWVASPLLFHVAVMAVMLVITLCVYYHAKRRH